MTLARRLSSALALAPPDDVSPGDIHGPLSRAAEPHRPAAVLVAITDRPRPGLILTQRTEAMRLHKGQVAFPGGRLDPGENATQAALREAWEELALSPASAQVIGHADPYLTITGFHVTPVVAIVPPDLPLLANPGEVADWFEPPLDHLMDPANHHREMVVIDGHTRHYWQIKWQDRRIWGATAAMLVNLSKRLST